LGMLRKRVGSEALVARRKEALLTAPFRVVVPYDWDRYVP
jgi:hypothetical protein